MRRAGFTLAELVIACAIGTAAAGLMTATLARQQRFYRSVAEKLDSRAQLRDAAHVLAADLRSASVAAFGLPVMSDSAVEMYGTIATSVACSAPSPFTVALPPTVLASGNTLTSMLAQPDTGDIALVFAATSSAPDSGSWEPLRIATFTTRVVSTTCPPSTGFTSSGDLTSGSPAFFLTLASAPSTPARRGTPFHFVRRARYSLYKSTDSRWYLGHRRCNQQGSCSSIQPVSGPYLPYAENESGLVFRYFDKMGSELPHGSSGFDVTRIEIVMRGETAPVSLTVSPRNR